MFRHLFRKVGEKNGLLFIKDCRHRTNARKLRTDLDRRRVRFRIDIQELHTVSVITQYVKRGAVQG
jgi:phage head maturation protease